MTKVIGNGKLEFITELALEIGLNESIVLQQLFIGVQKSNTILGGNRWIKHTYDDWQKVFPFWSISTIKRALVSLQEKGYILVEQHGRQNYDRTNWYTVVEDQLPVALTEVGTVNEVSTAAREDDQQQIDENMSNDVQEKYTSVKKRMKELRFFPLKKQQKAELIDVCRSYPVEKIISALEKTAAKCIYAWKYAYKVLITNVNNFKSNTNKWAVNRKIIRKENVPDWFEDSDKKLEQVAEMDGDMLEKKRRLEAIQRKYREKA